MSSVIKRELVRIPNVEREQFVIVMLAFGPLIYAPKQREMINKLFGRII